MRFTKWWLENRRRPRRISQGCSWVVAAIRVPMTPDTNRRQCPMHRGQKAMTRSRKTIEQVLDEFLAEQQARWSPRPRLV